MNEKRYYTFNHYLKQRFGGRVQKIAIDAGFTCPNIDGTKGAGGCTYCNNEGFSYNSRRPPRSIEEQIENGAAFMRKRFKADKFMAYFQANTNTYAPLGELKKLYDRILPYPEIVSMAVGTRPDCVSPRTLDLLESYADRMEVWVEYGLQSSHNRTLERINRCDTYENFLWAIDAAAGRNLKICVHVILGLPGETHEDMMRTAGRLAPLPYHSIKVHLMHIMKNTLMEEEYQRGEISIFTMDEYARTVCDFLERLHPDVSVQRLTADAPPEVLVAPTWCLQRKTILEMIDAELERRDTQQGVLVPANIREDQSWRDQIQKGNTTPVIPARRLAS